MEDVNPVGFPEGLRVLAVDDDATCLKITCRMLQFCKYTVTACNRSDDALSLVQERRREFDLVITDVRMPVIDGFQLLHRFGVELDIPVVLMSADNEKDTMMKGLKQGALFYLVKPISMCELKNIWQLLVMNRQKVDRGVNVEHGFDQELTMTGREEVEQNKVGDVEVDCASVNEGNWKQTKRSRSKGKKVAAADEESGEDNEEISAQKKQRIVWNTELHEQFLNAVNRIGIDRAVPKKILEYMKVPGLTRENVASHLQKYRLYLKKVEEANHAATIGVMPRHHFLGKSIFGPVPFLPSRQPSGFSRFVVGPSSGHSFMLGSNPNPYAPMSTPTSQMASFGAQSQTDTSNASLERFNYLQYLLENQGTSTHQVNPCDNFQSQAYQPPPQDVFNMVNNTTEVNNNNNFSSFGGMGSLEGASQTPAVVGCRENGIIPMQPSPSELLGLDFSVPCTEPVNHVVSVAEHDSIPDFSLSSLNIPELDSLSAIPKSCMDMHHDQHDNTDIGDILNTSGHSLSDIVGDLVQETNSNPNQLPSCDFHDIFLKEQQEGNEGDGDSMDPEFDIVDAYRAGDNQIEE